MEAALQEHTEQVGVNPGCIMGRCGHQCCTRQRTTSISFRRICRRARCRDAASRIVVGKIAKRRLSARSDADCFVAHANGRPRDQIDVTHGTVLFGHLGQTRCPCCKTDSPRFQTKSQTFLMGTGAWLLGRISKRFRQPSKVAHMAGGAHPPHQHGPSRTSRLPLPNTIFGRRLHLPKSCAADQAHLRSHSGAGSSDVL